MMLQLIIIIAIRAYYLKWQYKIMIKKIKVLNKENKPTLEEKRIMANSIDLKDNMIMENLSNGYTKISAIDINKRFSKVGE